MRVTVDLQLLWATLERKVAAAVTAVRVRQAPLEITRSSWSPWLQRCSSCWQVGHQGSRGVVFAVAAALLILLACESSKGNFLMIAVPGTLLNLPLFILVQIFS